MTITPHHFIAKHTIVMKDGKPLGMAQAVDTELMVAAIITGHDFDKSQDLLELVKIDEVCFRKESLEKDSLSKSLYDNYLSNFRLI